MNSFVEYITTELVFIDGTKTFLNDSAKFEKCICEENNYTTIQIKSHYKSVRKIRIKLRFKEDESNKNVLIHKSIASGYKKVTNEEITSKYFFSVFDNDGMGITFMNALPSKFDSNIIYNNGEVILETVIPYSYTGDTISEKFVISDKAPYTEALLYNAKKHKCKKSFEDVTGWGSWDYYFTSIDEDSVKENVDFIYNDETLREKIKYIAIDDGWQQREGDWKEGCRFSKGLKNTVDYIKEKGFLAGIWTAPTRLHCLSGTVMRRNSFLVRDELGDPIFDDVVNYVADPTHPEGERYIKEIYTYLKECGFDYYKIDFISNMLMCDRFYDENAGPYDALRKLISIIRECVGEECHIMGCSLPYAFGGEGVDSRRTGLDIHNTWKHLVKCTEIYAPQFASHRTIYQNDLDYLVVRGKDTSFEEETNVFNPYAGRLKSEKTEEFRWRDGEDFTYEEAKMWCVTVLMSGSSVILSDRMTALNEKGLWLIKKTLEYADFVSAHPDVGSDALPSVWRKDGWIYIFNYSNEEKEFSVNADGVYKEAFSEEKYETVKGLLKLRLKPHTCLALKKI